MDAIFKVPFLNPTDDKINGDDLVDRFHYFVTVYLLAFAGFIIGLKEFAGEPLDCWVNLNSWQHFQGHVNSYCWANKMYSFPNMSNLSEVPYPLVLGLPGPEAESSNAKLKELNFYRWVTVIIFIQAFLFKLPSLFWNQINEYSGTQIEKMVPLMTGSTFEPKEKREALAETMAVFLETWFLINRRHAQFMISDQTPSRILRYFMFCVRGNSGTYLSSMYLFIKFIYLFNVLVQFIVLTAFLDFNYWNYGPHAISNFPSDLLDDRFPRIGLCHFQIIGQGYWIQCILSINMLLEIIFLVEWFWLLMLLTITTISFVSWLYRILLTQSSVNFINKYLINSRPGYHLPHEQDKTVHNFVASYLSNDGVFLLRILAIHTNDAAMAKLLGSIWLRYISYGKTVDDANPNKNKVEVYDKLNH